MPTPERDPAERRAPVRAADADRELVEERLREHYAAGRLTLDELMQRTDEAHGAATVAELQHALRGLPAEPAGPASPPARRQSGRATAAMVLGIIGLVVPTALVLPVLALVLGLSARSEIASDPGLAGASRASAGAILGALGIVIHLIVLAVLIL